MSLALAGAEDTHNEFVNLASLNFLLDLETIHESAVNINISFASLSRRLKEVLFLKSCIVSEHYAVNFSDKEDQSTIPFFKPSAHELLHLVRVQHFCLSFTRPDI